MCGVHIRQLAIVGKLFLPDRMEGKGLTRDRCGRWFDRNLRDCNVDCTCTLCLNDDIIVESCGWASFDNGRTASVRRSGGFK